MAKDYALVAYLRDGVGEFARRLRAALTPQQSQLRPHVTILPPRNLAISESEAAKRIAEKCAAFGPVRISFSQVESFLPVNAAIYLRVADGARHLRAMHDELNGGELYCAEPWPYLPHLTLAHFTDGLPVALAIDAASARWNDFRGPRESLIDELAFVREDREDWWQDLAVFPLGG